MLKIKGIDVSYHNGTIDWAKVAADGIEFAVIREGYRKTIDTQFLANVKGAVKNNIPVMVYHFVYTNGATIKENAESTVANMKSAGLDVSTTYVWADLEYDTWVKNGEKCTRALCSEYTQQYIDALKALGCKKIGVYMNTDYYKNYYTSSIINNYPVWLADYSGDPDYDCVIHQYGSSGTVNGINSSGIDVDYLIDESILKTTSTKTTTGENSMSTVYVVNSGHDENGQYAGGAAGDQTGTECEIKAWYQYSPQWNVYIEHPNAQVREVIARKAIQAAQNDHIGYDMGTNGNSNDRYTLWAQLKANNYDPSKITVNCEADCSEGVICFAKATGYELNIDALKNISIEGYTGSLASQMKAAGFNVYYDNKYLTSSNYVRKGGFLLCEGHHVCTVVTDGAYVTSSTTTSATTTATSSTNSSYVGKGIGTAVAKEDMNVRASVNGTLLKAITKGTSVEVLEQQSNGWLKIVWKDCANGYAFTSNIDGAGKVGAYYVVTLANKYVKLAQTEINKCVGTQLKSKFGHTLDVDGIVGNETITGCKMILQWALNKDYPNLKLAIDGSIGSLTKAGLGNHYIAYGEKQYLVTAMQIILSAMGYDVNGVEYPGIYGNGLKAITTKLGITSGSDARVTATNILKVYGNLK